MDRFHSVSFRRLVTVALALAALSTCKPTPTVDALAGDLAVGIHVIDTDAHPSDGKVPIFVQFFRAGTFVQLAGNATVTCNNVTMTWNGLGYAERVPAVPIGSTYACVHRRNNVSSTATLTVPPRPTFITPGNGSTVPRSTNLTIGYVADGGVGMRATAGDGASAQGGAHEPQPDNGTFTDLDTTGMRAGPGSVSLVRELSLSGVGPAFQSVTVTYRSGAQIQVTWT
jgi:hypothetical protein